MKGTYLGEFEEIILLTVASLETKAYGISVKADVELRTDRSINLSAIHASLYRLERKSYLKSELGEATAKRGGKRKRYFQITPEGIKALKLSRELREELWQSIPSYILESKQ